MPNNASGFVDASQWAELNQGDEERLLQEAMARAEAADTTAATALRTSRIQAEGRQADGSLDRSKTATLETVGSYTDYLQAKKSAENAWAAVTAGSNDPRSNALRDRIRGERGMGDAAKAAEAQRTSQQDTASKYAIGDVANTAKNKARSEAERAAKEQADRARADRDKRLKGDFQQTVRRKMADYWGFADAAQDNFFGANSNKGGEVSLGPNGTRPQANFNIYGQVDPFGYGNANADQLEAIGKNAGLGQGELDAFRGPATYSWGKRTKGGS